jgi:hypothetical protein
MGVTSYIITSWVCISSVIFLLTLILGGFAALSYYQRQYIYPVILLPFEEEEEGFLGDFY